MIVAGVVGTVLVGNADGVETDELGGEVGMDEVGVGFRLPGELPSEVAEDCWLTELEDGTEVSDALGKDLAVLVALPELALLAGPQPAKSIASPAPATARAKPPTRSLRLPCRNLRVAPPLVTWNRCLILIPVFPPGRYSMLGALPSRSTFRQPGHYAKRPYEGRCPFRDTVGNT